MMTDVGEYVIALEAIIAGLANEHIPVPPETPDQLVELCAVAEIDSEFLAGRTVIG